MNQEMVKPIRPKKEKFPVPVIPSKESRVEGYICKTYGYIDLTFDSSRCASVVCSSGDREETRVALFREKYPDLFWPWDHNHGNFDEFEYVSLSVRVDDFNEFVERFNVVDVVAEAASEGEYEMLLSGKKIISDEEYSKLKEEYDIDIKSYKIKKKNETKKYRESIEKYKLAMAKYNLWVAESRLKRMGGNDS